MFSARVFTEFETHASKMREASRARRDAVQLRAAVDDDADAVAIDVRDTLGVPQPQDKFKGCTNLRTLRTLLSIVDDRGFERSAHQLAFHSAFERCVARVVYKTEWSTNRPAIMRHNNWPRCNSEVLISTPRRFGKTFSIAIFFACMALAFGCEIVVFSPARRASRKLLERMVEFVRLLGCDDHIVEYNQEQCRVKSYDGKSSLIRSFPSKVGVGVARRSNPLISAGFEPKRGGSVVRRKTPRAGCYTNRTTTTPSRGTG